MNEQQIRDWTALMAKLENARQRAEKAQTEAQQALAYIADCQVLLQRVVPERND